MVAVQCLSATFKMSARKLGLPIHGMADHGIMPVLRAESGRPKRALYMTNPEGNFVQGELHKAVNRKVPPCPLYDISGRMCISRPCEVASRGASLSLAVCCQLRARGRLRRAIRLWRIFSYWTRLEGRWDCNSAGCCGGRVPCGPLSRTSCKPPPRKADSKNPSHPCLSATRESSVVGLPRTLGRHSEFESHRETRFFPCASRMGEEAPQEG